MSTSLRSRLVELGARLRPRVWFTRRALAVALGITALLALGSAWFPLVALAVAATVSLGGAVVADLVLILRAHVAVRREEPERFTLGLPGRLRYTVRNASPFAIAVEIVEAGTPILDFGEAAARTRVAAGTSAQAEAFAVPRERGDAMLALFAYRFTSPLGLLARVVRVTSPAAVRVWPDLSLLRQGGALTQRRRTIEAGLRRLPFRGTGTEFESLRDYTLGDAFRDVAWRATARRGKPIVVAHTIERSQQVIVVLDAGRLMLGRSGAERKFDRALTGALTLAAVAAAEGDAVGALAFAGEILEAVPPRSGNAHAAALASRLHALQPRREEADYESAFALLARRQSKRGLVVIFTDLFDPVAASALVANLGRLARRHLVLVVVAGDDDVDAALAEPAREARGAYEAAVATIIGDDRRRAIAILERAGASVLDVPGGRLPVELVNRYVGLKSRGAI